MPAKTPAPSRHTSHKPPSLLGQIPRPGPKPLFRTHPHLPPPSPAWARFKPPSDSPRRSRSQEPSNRQRHPDSSSARHSYERPPRDKTRWRSVSPRARAPLRQPQIGLRRRMTRDAEFSGDEATPARPPPDSPHRIPHRPSHLRPQPRPSVGRYATAPQRPGNKRRPSYDTPRTPRYPPGFRPAQGDSPRRTPTTPRSRSKEVSSRRREPEWVRPADRPMRHAERPPAKPEKPAEKPSQKQSPSKGLDFLDKLPQAFAAYLGLKSLSDYADKAKEWTDWLGDIKEAPEEMNALSAKTTTARDTITQIQNAIKARPDLLEGESGSVLREQVETAMEDARVALKKLTKMLQELDTTGNRGAMMNEIDEFYRSYRYKDEWEDKIKEADKELEKQLGTLSVLMVNIYSRSLANFAPPGLDNPIPPPGQPVDTKRSIPVPVKLDPPPVGQHWHRSEEKTESDMKEGGKEEKKGEKQDETTNKRQQPTPPPQETTEATDKDPESVSDDPGEILLDAAWNGDLEACANALRSASPDTRDPRGLTPPHLASERDHLAIAMLLNDHLSSSNTGSLSGRTPLHLASRYASSAMVEFLLNDAKADPNAQDVNGRTPLHYAALAGDDDERRDVVRMLRDAKGDPTMVDDRGRTARELAQKRDYWDVAATLRRAEKRWEEEHHESRLHRHRFT